jgi:hypothetical protein
MVNCVFLTSFIFSADKHIYESHETQFYVCTYVHIVTDLLKPRPTIGLWAHGSACFAQLYLGSVLRNSV